jgi:hypothetical protein
MDALARRLCDVGFRRADLPEYEHQLPPFVDSAGRVVELHRHIPGVRVEAGGRFATLSTLRATSLLVPIADLPGDCSAPTREVVAAHILVHGIGQHGHAPDSYPQFRMIGDLIDLGAGGEGSPLDERAQAFLEGQVTSAERFAAEALCRRLVTGDPTLFDTKAVEGALLRHLVAGALDADYRKALRLSGFVHGQTQASRACAMVKALWGAVRLTDGQIDAVYGRPKTRLGYLGRRLARPFDLLVRLSRYLRSALRLRLKRIGAVRQG